MVETTSDQMDGDNLLSLQEAATDLGLSYDALLRWRQRGDLKASKVGAQYVVRRDDLEEFRTWYEAHPRAQRALKGLQKAEAQR